MVKEVEYKGVKLCYSRQGVGDTLVLLHGFLEDGSMWDDFVHLYQERYDLIIVELLGNGTSGCLGYVHSMVLHAEAVNTILDAEKIEESVMIGHSLGGYIALAFAENFKDRLKGYGMFFSTAFPDSESKKQDRERAISAIQEHPELFVEMAIPKLFVNAEDPAISLQVKGLIALAKSQPKQGIIANTRGMKDRPDRRNILRNSDLPVLFIHGESDPVLPNDNAAEQCKGCDHISTHFLDGVGHMGHIEAPELCFRAIDEFMQSIKVHG